MVVQGTDAPVIAIDVDAGIETRVSDVVASGTDAQLLVRRVLRPVMMIRLGVLMPLLVMLRALMPM